MYKKVNDMLGDLVKVTPSSKMVGDLAIFMVQNDLTPENIVEKGEHLTFPDSVVSYFKGMMGQPPCGFPVDLQKIVLKGEEPITCRPGELLAPVDFEAAKKEVEKFCPNPTMRDVISYCIYPKVVEEYWKHSKEYGYLMRMAPMSSSMVLHWVKPIRSTSKTVRLWSSSIWVWATIMMTVPGT